MQALDRTQPGLPMKRGRAGTMRRQQAPHPTSRRERPQQAGGGTHDYKRYGTTTLFAALDILSGKVIGQCMLQHRAIEFVRFLRRIDKATPSQLDLHLILDNYAAHKAPAVKRWLARHPRFHLHFTPTSASWANAVEGFVQLTSD